MIHYSGLFRVEAVVCVSISGFEWSLSRLFFNLLTREDSFTDGGLECIKIPVHMYIGIFPIDCNLQTKWTNSCMNRMLMCVFVCQLSNHDNKANQ